MSAETGPAVSVELAVEENHAVIRCGRCGVELTLWTKKDLAIDGIAALFTQEHLHCTPRQRKNER